jgi:hypothetical protein
MKIAALCLGAISFVVAHVLNVSILAFVYGDSSSEVSPVFDVIFEYSFWLVFVIPGIVAAIFAKERRLLHGFAVGSIAGGLSVLFVLFNAPPGESINVFSAVRIIALAVVLSTVGGAIVRVLEYGIRR